MWKYVCVTMTIDLSYLWGSLLFIDQKVYKTKFLTLFRNSRFSVLVCHIITRNLENVRLNTMPMVNKGPYGMETGTKSCRAWWRVCTFISAFLSFFVEFHKRSVLTTHTTIVEVMIDEALMHVCGVSVESLKSLGFDDYATIEEVR